jgi:hypothetical protein
MDRTSFLLALEAASGQPGGGLPRFKAEETDDFRPGTAPGGQVLPPAADRFAGIYNYSCNMPRRVLANAGEARAALRRLRFRFVVLPVNM